MNHPRMRRRRVSRGQALIELALFFPLLMFIVVGSTDIATLLDDHLSIVYAARTGARVGAVMGQNQYADCAIIGAVQAALANDHNVTLNQIIIYEAGQSGGDATGQPRDAYPGSTTCISTSVNSGTPSAACTVCTWAPASRNVTPFAEQSIGVELDYTYTYSFTPFGGGQFSSKDYAIMPLEVIIIENATPTPTP